jgi:glycerate-2-kinase
MVLTDGPLPRGRSSTVTPSPAVATPGPSLTASDSATYLETSGDLIVTGPTGTNVSDLWIFWP